MEFLQTNFLDFNNEVSPKALKAVRQLLFVVGTWIGALVVLAVWSPALGHVPLASIEVNGQAYTQGLRI